MHSGADDKDGDRREGHECPAPGGAERFSRQQQERDHGRRQRFPELLPIGHRRLQRRRSGAEEVLHGDLAFLGAGLAPLVSMRAVMGINRLMKLEGIHHVSSITGDAQANVDFYAGVLGLRLVKKTVNQDDPSVYHLFYGDDAGSPGLDLTFFEYPRATRGRAGQGMIHRIVLRVASEAALDFWERRLGNGKRSPGSFEFSDPEGLGLELRVVETSDAPLTAANPEIPAEPQ